MCSVRKGAVCGSCHRLDGAPSQQTQTAQGTAAANAVGIAHGPAVHSLRMACAHHWKPETLSMLRPWAAGGLSCLGRQ